ncbi:MAG: hypothetical protein NDJ89_12465 [Oligoflexia bacterium]|nr:hypothetical protein [Oligoflexia bacterium]
MPRTRRAHAPAIILLGTLALTSPGCSLEYIGRVTQPGPTRLSVSGPLAKTAQLDGSLIGNGLVSGGIYYSSGSDEMNTELWRSDGTASGTYRIKDINPLTNQLGFNAGSTPTSFTEVDGTIFFTADDGLRGRELWKTDGTEAGTLLVKDLLPGADSSSPLWLTSFNGLLLFTAYNASSKRELWKSDGTEAGTEKLYSGSSHVSYLIPFQSSLFFVSQAPPSRLWKTDGTSAGTVAADFYTGSIDALFSTGGSLYFSGTLGTQSGFWKSDGTLSGTILLIPGRSYSPFWMYLEFFQEVGPTLYVTLMTTDSNRELWKTDGTPEGSSLVKVFAGTTPPMAATLFLITSINGVLYFTAHDGAHGTELWRTDGSEAGTRLVKDIYPGEGSGISSILVESQTNWHLTLNGFLWFMANDGIHGEELWRTDGTEGGTELVQDIHDPGKGGLTGLINLNGSFLAISSLAGGGSLWRLPPSP